MAHFLKNDEKLEEIKRIEILRDYVKNLSEISKEYQNLINQIEEELRDLLKE